jgi:hypothetical protein
MNIAEENIIYEALTRLKDLTGIEGYRAKDLKDLKDLQESYRSTENLTEPDLYIIRDNVIEIIEVKKVVQPYHIPQIIENARHRYDCMVIAEYIYPAQKQVLKENGIGYLDTAGNIYLENKHNLIWLEGNKHIEEEKPASNRAFTKAGLRTLFYFLLNEEALNLPYRMLAQATGGALGNMKYIIEGLTEAGFILQVGPKRKVLQKKKMLLERWITGYQEILKPALHMGDFNFWDEDKQQHWDTLITEDDKTIWGGEAAAALFTNYLNPAYLTVYTENNRAQMLRNWKLIPNKDGQLKMYEKFWVDTSWDTKKIAPPLLVYADLITTNDPRCIETAMIIYDKYLKDEFEQR